MSGIDTVEATNIVKAMTGEAAYVATVAPLLARLCATIGTGATSGTEVVNAGGSSYARQNATTALGATATGNRTNTGTLTFTNVPTVTSPGVQSIEFWDSAGTSIRKCFAALTAAKITALGDSISFPPGSLNIGVA